MNVQELINQLQNMDPDAEVMFQYNYGDYWRTEVAAEVKGVRMDEVVYSNYHQMHKVVEEDRYGPNDDEEDEYAEDKPDTKRVVILCSGGW